MGSYGCKTFIHVWGPLSPPPHHGMVPGPPSPPRPPPWYGPRPAKPPPWVWWRPSRQQQPRRSKRSIRALQVASTGFEVRVPGAAACWLPPPPRMWCGSSVGLCTGACTSCTVLRAENCHFWKASHDTAGSNDATLRFLRCYVLKPTQNEWCFDALHLLKAESSDWKTLLWIQ